MFNIDHFRQVIEATDLILWPRLFPIVSKSEHLR